MTYCCKSIIVKIFFSPNHDIPHDCFWRKPYQNRAMFSDSESGMKGPTYVKNYWVYIAFEVILKAYLIINCAAESTTAVQHCKVPIANNL